MRVRAVLMGDQRMGVDRFSPLLCFTHSTLVKGKCFFKFLTKLATELTTLTDFVRQEEVMAYRVAELTQVENVTEWG